MNQPYLHAQSIVLRAPIQCWSAPDGQVLAPADLGQPAATSIAQGLLCGDDRTVSRLVLQVTGRQLEHVCTTEPGGSSARYDYVVRTPELGIDPQVTIERRRDVTGDSFAETLTVRQASVAPLTLELVVELTPDATPMTDIKSGLPPVAVEPVAVAPGQDSVGWAWRDADTSIHLTAPGARLEAVGDRYCMSWTLEVPARSEATVGYRVQLSDAAAPFVASTAPELVLPDLTGADASLRLMVEKSFLDLGALRLAERAASENAFLAAGAPWFFTLFGRDSLIAARLLLPTNVELAASTLEVLAGRQGTRIDVDNAEQPGKILHEVRRVALELHDTHVSGDHAPNGSGEGNPGESAAGAQHSVLPPEYFGTIDATPLWILLFADAVDAGMDAGRARALVPALLGALGWLRDHADADGDGFLEYFDLSGHGLANQGWKDSGDSIRWSDGSQAKGPIALVEVQGYAHAALLAGHRLLLRLAPEQASDEWVALARDLKHRFREHFWVEDDLGRYPALALDADKRPVDGVSSNMGHLLGTGILDADEARLVVDRLMHPSMRSGYGIRTLSTTNAGYWPLGYHVGSVWTHDTAVIIDAMRREGFTAPAAELARDLLRAAVGFGYRMPELYGGQPADEIYPPMPYPAACRPQAWAAASAVPVLRALQH